MSADPAAPAKEASRRYAGRTAEERRADRRRRLELSATEIWVADGWAAVSMRAVCARAGLTDRYFYEEFRNAEDLLARLWDQAQQRVLDAILADAVQREGEAPRTRLAAGIATFVTHLATHPDDRQVLHGDSSGCPVITTRQRQARAVGVELITGLAEPVLAADVDRDDFRVLARMAMGGLLELVAAWQAGDVPGSVEEVVDHATRFADQLAASVSTTWDE